MKVSKMMMVGVMRLLLASALTLSVISSSYSSMVSADNVAGEKSTIKIMFPSDLATNSAKEEYDHSEGLFGIPRYGTGKKIVGEIVYMTYKDEHTGCQDYPYKPPKDGENYIFLVDRGDCSFVQKVRMAQNRGATAVIIADDVCLCKNKNDPAEAGPGRTKKLKETCSEKNQKATMSGRFTDGNDCETTLPFMADDGTGADIVIPSFLIDFYHAQILKDCYLSANSKTLSLATPPESVTGFNCTEASKIIASMEWTLPAPDNNVEYDLWTSSDSEAKFKTDFHNIAIQLKDSTTFTPHYFVWDGTKWGCNVGDNPCKTQCTDGGLYCNPDPDNDIFSGVSGKDVVDENLRQLCVWKQAEPDLRKNGAELWWQYVIEFAKQCHPGALPTPDKFNAKCSEAVHKSVSGLSWDKTQSCVSNSWNNDKKTNTILSAEINARIAKNILQLPTVVVNDVIIRGGVNSPSVLSAVCAGFEKGSAPTICDCSIDKTSSTKIYECISKLCSTGFFCEAKQKCVTNASECSNEGTSTGSVFGIVIFAMIVLGAAGILYWRRQRTRMQEEVRNIISEYMPLEEFENRTGSGRAGIATPSRPIVVPTTNPDDQESGASELSQNGNGNGHAHGKHETGVTLL